MKVAVLLSGQVRPEAFDSFLESTATLLANIKADIFVHTWEQSGSSMNHNPVGQALNHSTTSTSQSYLSELSARFNVKAVEVEDQQQWLVNLSDDLSSIQNSLVLPLRSKWSLPQLYSIYRAWCLVDQPYNYDFILRIRFDNLFVSNLLPELERIRSSKSYLSTAYSINFGRAFFPSRVYDIFFLSHPDVFRVLASTWPLITSLIRTPAIVQAQDPRDSCDLLYKSLICHQLDHSSLHIRYTDVYRGEPVAKYLSKIYLWQYSINNKGKVLHPAIKSSTTRVRIMLYYSMSILRRALARNKYNQRDSSNIHIITFAHGPFLICARFQGLLSRLLGHKHTIFSPSSLPRHINDYAKLNPKGYGYWQWKPFIISKVLRSIDSGKQLWYLDSTVFPFRSLKAISFSSVYIPYNLFMNPRNWCKYLDLPQFTDFLISGYIPDASHLGFMKDPYSLAFVDNWLHLCNTKHFIDDSDVLSHNDFLIQHRHDQALLGYNAYISKASGSPSMTQTTSRDMYFVHDRGAAGSVIGLVVLPIKLLIYALLSHLKLAPFKHIRISKLSCFPTDEH